jgi:hypothetical protein
MSTTARYIASLKSKVIAKSTKIQYKNHIVTTNNLYNGIIPCAQISPQQIVFSDKELSCCKPIPQIQIRHLIYDGGTPYASGSKIYDGGGVFRIFDGGSPYTNYDNIYDGLFREYVYDGGGITGITGNTFDANQPFIHNYDGGSVFGSSQNAFDGGTASSGGTAIYNSINVLSNTILSGSTTIIRRITLDGGNNIF